MQAILLAGGLGTRLRSVVSDRPKPMALIQDKPFMEYVIQELKKQGIDVTLVDPDAPEEEIEKTLAYIAGRDIRAVSERVMHILFQTLAMRYEFSLSDLTQPGLE